MFKFKVLIVAAAAVLMSACASSGPKVRTDRDPTADLGSYQKLGYTYDVRAPQLRVNFFVQVADRAEVRSTPATGFRPIAWAGYPREIETVGYKAGTLRIDLVDVARSASVWQGVAQGRIPEESLRNPGVAVDEAVRSIFRQFPDATQK